MVSTGPVVLQYCPCWNKANSMHSFLFQAKRQVRYFESNNIKYLISTLLTKSIIYLACTLKEEIYI